VGDEGSSDEDADVEAFDSEDEAYAYPPDAEEVEEEEEETEVSQPVGALAVGVRADGYVPSDGKVQKKMEAWIEAAAGFDFEKNRPVAEGRSAAYRQTSKATLVHRR
jgi:hypothetical protein